MLETILLVISLIIGVVLSTAVLLQQRGSGLGGAIGGGNGNAITTSKRGAEKWLYNGTVVLGIAFLVVNILLMVLV